MKETARNPNPNRKNLSRCSKGHLFCAQACLTMGYRRVSAAFVARSRRNCQGKRGERRRTTKETKHRVVLSPERDPAFCLENKFSCSRKDVEGSEHKAGSAADFVAAAAARIFADGTLPLLSLCNIFYHFHSHATPRLLPSPPPQSESS